MKIKEFLKLTKWKIIFAIVPSTMYVLAGIIYSYLMSLAMNGFSESPLYPIALILQFFILISYNFAQIPIILIGMLIGPFGLFISYNILNLINFIFLFLVWYIIACFVTLIYFKVKKK